jgi:hypothetical protein
MRLEILQVEGIVFDVCTAPNPFFLFLFVLLCITRVQVPLSHGQGFVTLRGIESRQFGLPDFC